MIRRQCWLNVWLVLALSTVSGCSSEGKPMVAVRGRLVYHLGETKPPALEKMPGPKLPINMSEAVAGATLRFLPVDASGTPGEARSDGQGHFAVETPNRGQGLTVGSYRVVVTLPSTFTKTVAPKYSSPEDTPFLVEVTKTGVDKLQLELKKE